MQGSARNRWEEVVRGQRSPGSVAERPTAVGGAAAAAAAVWKARCGSCAREVPRSERCGTPAPQHGRCREWGEARKRRSAPLWSRSHPPSLRPLPACCRKFLNWRWQTSLQARRCNSNPRRSLVNPLTRSRTPGLLYVYLEGWGCEGTSLKPLEMRVLAPAAQHPRTLSRTGAAQIPTNRRASVIHPAGSPSAV